MRLLDGVLQQLWVNGSAQSDDAMDDIRRMGVDELTLWRGGEWRAIESIAQSKADQRTQNEAATLLKQGFKPTERARGAVREVWYESSGSAYYSPFRTGERERTEYRDDIWRPVGLDVWKAMCAKSDFYVYPEPHERSRPLQREKAKEKTK
jgi:hypothetical protein